MSQDGPDKIAPSKKRKRRVKKMATELSASSLEEATKRPKKRARKESDPEWKPGNANRHRKNDSHGSITALNGLMSSPATHGAVICERTTTTGPWQLSSDPKLTFSSPENGVCSSGLTHDDIPHSLALSRTIKTHLGMISVFLPKEKIQRLIEELPEPPTDLKRKLRALNLPTTNTMSITDAVISLKTLNAVVKLKGGRTQPRVPSNQQVTKVSANKVAKTCGLSGNDWQWWHLLGHALIGDHSQNMSNFILGRKDGNGVMNDIAESLVRKILTGNKDLKELYLSAHVSFVPGFEKARLGKRLTWVLKDGPEDNYTKIVKFDFLPTAHEVLCKTEIEEFSKILIAAFNRKIALNTPTKVLLPLDLMTPSPVKSASGELDLSRLIKLPKLLNLDTEVEASSSQSDTLSEQDKNEEEYHISRLSPGIFLGRDRALRARSSSSPTKLRDHSSNIADELKPRGPNK